MGSPFNNDISQWYTSKVTSMSGMFEETPFNKDISQWDTSNINEMSWMFKKSQFDQDISQWDVSNVNDMSWMFDGSTFSQNLCWNVSDKTTEGMFWDADGCIESNCCQNCGKELLCYQIRVTINVY